MRQGAHQRALARGGIIPAGLADRAPAADGRPARRRILAGEAQA